MGGGIIENQNALNQFLVSIAKVEGKKLISTAAHASRLHWPKCRALNAKLKKMKTLNLLRFKDLL